MFLVNLPFALLALVLAPRLLPADPPREQRSTQVSLDPVGAGLLGLSVVAVLLPLVLADRDPAGAPWWTIAIGAALLGAFVWWERRYAARGGDPLANGRVLRSPGYVLGSSLGTIYMAGSTAIFFVLTVYFQQGLGYSALQAGAASLPYAVGSAIAAAVGGRVVGRFGRPLVVAGTVVMAVGIVATLLIVRAETGATVGLLTAPPLFLSGIGSGLVITPNQALTLQDVPTDEGGTAAGMQQTAQRIGSSIGVALVASVFFTVLSSSNNDYGAALSTGMLVIVAFVVAAFALGLGDILRGRGRAARESEDGPTSSDDDEQRPADDEDARHCARGYASSGRSHAGHTYH